MRAIISRFAPAPTGFLHLGHALNAACVWGVSRLLTDRSSNGAPRVLVRVEDHDRQRSRREYEAAMLEDLAWLGFVTDGEMVRQSDREEIYTSALDTLRAVGRVYACGCSRAAIGAASSVTSDDQELCYPGTCRERGLPERAGFGIRIRLDAVTESFVDLRHGPQAQRPSDQCGDLLARDRDGNWTYQFAATVDDLVQGVTLVVRGDDLLASTGRQIQLARLLGRAEAPMFLHHPLIMKSATQKLSKSDGDSGVRDLRAHGCTPADVIGRSLALAGLLSESRFVRADEVSSIMSALIR